MQIDMDQSAAGAAWRQDRLALPAGRQCPAARASSLALIELSVRLRYEFSRRFAPYIGFTWDRALGGSADLRTRAGEPVGDLVFVAGVRMLL